MKLSTIFAAVAALMLTASCGILGGSTSTTQTPTSSGQASGAALKSLYTQYKTDGKIDMSNINNIINLATLSQCVGELKDAGTVDKSDYIKEFVTGLILGSNNLVNQNNSTGVVNNLTTLAGIDLSSVTGAAATLIANGAASATTAANNAAATTATAVNQTTAAAASANQAVTDAISSVTNATSEVTTAVNTVKSIFNLFAQK